MGSGTDAVSTGSPQSAGRECQNNTCGDERCFQDGAQAVPQRFGMLWSHSPQPEIGQGHSAHQWFTHGILLNNTVYSLLLFSRNSRTCFDWPEEMPNTLDPSWVGGRFGSPFHTTASSFTSLTALVFLCSAWLPVNRPCVATKELCCSPSSIHSIHHKPSNMAFLDFRSCAPTPSIEVTIAKVGIGH